MVDPIVLEFDLTRDELKGFFASRAQHIRASVLGALLFVLGILLLITGNSDGDGRSSGFGVFCIVFGAFVVIGLARAPQIRQRLAERLAGSTKIQLSDRGVEYGGANIAERIEWSRMMRVIDRPHCWVLMTKAPVATYYIPKAAVPADRQQAFTAQLSAWAGKTYKTRKR